MRNKFVCIFVFTLLIFSSISFAVVHANSNQKKEKKYITSAIAPDDFNLDAFCGGYTLWTEIYRIQIDNEGNGIYSICYPENRETSEYTEITQFDLDENELNQLWDEIQNNDFFNLEDYSELDLFPDSDIIVSGGTFATIIVTANGEKHAVETRHFTVTEFDNIMIAINGLTPEENDLFYNGLLNSPPQAPSIPFGLQSGNYKEEQTYSTSCFDFDWDDLYFRFDWGDGTISDWIGPFESLENVSMNHKWNSKGDYEIKAQAKDDPNGDGDLSDGIESEWSNSTKVSMPKIKNKNILIENILKKISKRYSIFNIFLRFLQKNYPITKFKILQTQVPPTEITLDEVNCKITITIRIKIWGEGASDQLASNMETAIENKLNKDKDGKPWYLKCPKDECEETEPGCLVVFDFIIKYEKNPKSGEGYHIFYVGPAQNSMNANPNKKRFVSFTYTADKNKNDNIVDFPRPNDVTSTWPLKGDTKIFHFGGTCGVLHADDRVGTWAHEFLHCLGLDDKYDEVWVDADGDKVRDANEVKTKPKDGHKDDIMANATKWLQQWGIDRTMERINMKCPCSCCPEDQDGDPPENKIDEPPQGAEVSSPIIVVGHADDGPDGSGVALLDYSLEWDGGSYDGGDYPIDPPQTHVDYNLGPINIEYFIDPGDWITITTYATDAQGNTGEDSVTVTYVEDEDTTPPVTKKTIGEPNEDGGYVIWPFTPITFDATDDDSGVNNIYYEVWWDTDGDEIVDALMGSETVYDDSLTFSVDMWGILIGIIELRWYATDNAGNQEVMHFQEHYVQP